MNLVVLTGRLTREVEVREIPNGTHVAEFSIAVRRETKEDMADFVNVQAWRQQADYLSSHAHKGTLISVQGKYREDKYVDRDGINQRKIYIMADRVEVLSQPKEVEKKPSVEQSNKEFVNSIINTPYADNFGSNLSNYAGDEEELPFY